MEKEEESQTSLLDATRITHVKAAEVVIACDWEYAFGTFCITLQSVEILKYN